MPREKQKEAKANKIVEVGAELAKDELVPVVSDVPLTESENMPFSSSSMAAVKQPVAPSNALKNTVLRALPFVLISLFLFAVPFFLSDFNVLWLKYSQVRTYMLCALIWNLIGACLYAQVNERKHKLFIILVFALPLITSHSWASFMYMLEMGLRSILNAPL